MKKLGLIFFLLVAVYTQANTIEVCANCEVTSLKEALEIATNGDTIYLKQGIYKEYDIQVDIEVSIIGEDGVIIDGEKKGNILSLLRASSLFW